MKDNEYQTFTSEVIGKPPLLYTEEKFSLSYIRCIFVMKKNNINMPIKGSCQIFTAPAKRYVNRYDIVERKEFI